MQEMLGDIKSEFPDVLIKYSGAEEAAIALMKFENKPAPKLTLNLDGQRAIIEVVEGEIFGPQPFLAIKTKEGNYYHDNLDVIHSKKKWSYVFDDQTFELDNIAKIGVGTAGLFGKKSVAQIILSEEE